MMLSLPFANWVRVYGEGQHDSGYQTFVDMADLNGKVWREVIFVSDFEIMYNLSPEAIADLVSVRAEIAQAVLLERLVPT